MKLVLQFNLCNVFLGGRETGKREGELIFKIFSELELNTQLENILYVLREVLPGSMVKTGMDNKLLEAWSFVSDDIKVQDPLVCLKGKDR